MTDRETLKAMFDRSGIEYEEDSKYPELISVHAGYLGFVSEFRFKADGSLEKVGAYE